MLMAALSSRIMQKFVFICITMGNYPLITGIAIRISVSVLSSYFKSSSFFGRFCFPDNRSDRCSTVRSMYVEIHDQTPHNDRFCPVSNSGMI